MCVAAIKAHDKLDKPDLIVIDHQGCPALVWSRNSVKPAIAICMPRAKTGPPTT